MKVTLLGYFSVGGVKIPKGAEFVGTFEDLPDWVQKEVKNKSCMIKVTGTPDLQKVVSPSKEKAEEAKKAEDPEAVKRIIRKPKAK